MERDSSKHSEFSPSSKSDESTASTETDKKKTKKTQSDNERGWSRVHSEEAKDDVKAKQTESLNTLWHRTIEEARKQDTKDSSSSPESVSEDKLDQLSQSEAKEVAGAYLTARRQEIAQELAGNPEHQVEVGDEQAALAADIYLATVENKLQTEPDIDIVDATDEAYREAALNYVPESALASADEDRLKRHDGQELAPEFNEPLDNEQSNDDGDKDGEPPRYSRTNPFSPDGRYSFGTGSTNSGGNLETIIERDFAAERVAAVRGLLVGGIIGYLIGRRRGRIKTEKRLIPIQKKLEREVGSLYSAISIKENQIRKLVHERERMPKLNNPESIYNQPQTLSYSRENSPFNQKQSGEDLLGPVKASSGEIVDRSIPKAEVLNQASLLEAGEKITVGSTTLRKVFETGLISERGLRRAVEEYARGGDVRRVLAEEVLIKELGYELDPHMRDRPFRKAAAPSSSAAIQPASHEQAAAVVAGKMDGPSPDSDNLLPPPIPASQRNVPSLLIIANVIALAVLVILLLILIVTHK